MDVIQPARVGPSIPTFTMGDRLRKAREGTGLTTREFALRLGVSQSTVTNAENDHTRTRRITLLMWSQVTGVPVEWLETGQAPD
ncbi:helix-turn-helix domain-containing protein [Nocardioides jensenii]|uniref:helix-turn-helix domain-containing protein n=1 Tax=Nocardioides jensenii TaxID=1843 RepID=UPI00082A09BC|nr:helix-turn-helix transcriptional regulator [Nocardioides jensenii]